MLHTSWCQECGGKLHIRTVSSAIHLYRHVRAVSSVIPRPAVALLRCSSRMLDIESERLLPELFDAESEEDRAILSSESSQPVTPSGNIAQPGPVAPNGISEARLDELRTKAEPGEDQRAPAWPRRVHWKYRNRRVHVCVNVVAHALLLRRLRFTSSNSVIGEWRYIEIPFTFQSSLSLKPHR